MKNKFQDRNLFYLIFILIAVFSYLARQSFYSYYIAHRVDNAFSLVITQTIIVSVFWMASLSGAILFYLFIKHRLRIIPPLLWALAFLINVIFWFADLKFVYFSGVEITPFLTSQAKGSGAMIWNAAKDPWIFAWIFFVWLVFRTCRRLFGSLEKNRRNIKFFALFFLAGWLLLPFASFYKNFQEYMVPSSFLAYYSEPDKPEPGNDPGAPAFLKKLKRFGIEYNFNRPDVLYHDRVYDSSQAELLTSPVIKNKPNILIVFLESFSNDATSIYNSNLPGITPNLERMANHPSTTVFNNFYNASTPTITGLIAELCSFIPPSGNEDMKKNGTMAEHQLLCLPEILKNNGYNDIFFLQAVEKPFANKNKVLENAGVETERIFGKDEVALFIGEQGLQKVVGSKPLSWGWSDHQLYPVFEEMIKSAGAKPFLGMLMTIDTHIPYVNSKDVITYPHPRANTGLNAFYTADDAFGKFWDYFLESDLKDNTILITVADHAAFPTFYTDMKDLFGGAKGKTFFDRTIFMVYVPNSTLPEEVDTYASSVDFAPTLLHILGLNVPNFFEGHSIFYDRKLYPNLLGVNEFTLYINQLDENGERKISFDDPRFMAGKKNKEESGELLTLSDFLSYYKWKRQVILEGRFWKKDQKDTAFLASSQPRLVAHAGGAVKNLTYSNSLQALNENYAHGFKYFEIDLSWTKDDELVLIHDWEDNYKKLFNREAGAPFSLFFKNLKMNQGLTQMDLDDLFAWLKSHQDVKIITDVKERNIEALSKISQTDFRDYFIVQVYNEEEIKPAQELGYKNVILTLYNTNYDNERVLAIAKKYDLFAIVMDKARADKGGLLPELDKIGATVLVHTLNSEKEMSELAENGADGFYTDFVTPKN